MAIGDSEEVLTELSSYDNEKNDFILPRHSGQALEASPGSDPGSGPENNLADVDAFLKSENDRSDYDWLLTPPGTPFISSLKKEQKTSVNLNGNLINHSTLLKPKQSNSETESLTQKKKVLRNSVLSSATKSTGAPLRRLSTTGGQTITASGQNNRSATPTGRPNIPTIVSKMSKSLRSSTPTSRAPVLSFTTTNKPKAAAAAPPVRSSTPTARSAPRSSTPTGTSRPFPTSKTGSRSSTPTYRPTIKSNGPPSNSSSLSSAPTTRPRSSSVSKIVPAVAKNPVPSRGISPSTRSRPLTSTKIIPSTKNVQQQCSRPVSATRTQAVSVSNQTSVAEKTAPANGGRPRRQSCSPSRGQKAVGNGLRSGGSSAVPGVTRSSRPAVTIGSDSPNPVLMGTQMVERVIHMRRLPPPKQDSPKAKYGNNSSGVNASSVKSSGFGRSLSKKSLDMAMRHMDIKRNMKGNTKQSTTNNFPASSMYSSSRSNGSSKSKSVSISDSPLATSSTTSSDLSVNNNTHCLYGSDLEDAECTGDRKEHTSQTNQNVVLRL